jgi:hypothetical protein
VDKTDAELVNVILNGLPIDAQPPARVIDEGVDIIPYAFDDLGDGVKAATLIKDVASSSLGLVFVRGDGTFVYRSRRTRTTGSGVFAFDNTMHGLSVPSTLDTVYNRVRVTIHPKTLDPAFTTVLYSLTGAAQAIGAGETVELWGNYRHPDDPQTPIGGIVNAQPVATTDFLGNALADGTGANMTSALTVTASAFASTVKFVVKNTGTTPLFLTKLQIRGKGVYDDGPQTYEAKSTQPYGDRPLALDMPYQDNPYVGQGAATYLEAQYRSPAGQLESIEFIANTSEDFLLQALLREPGDLVTISETVTGVTEVDAVIQSVEFDITSPSHIVCRWGLAPSTPYRAWLLGTPGSTELGVATMLGF